MSILNYIKRNPVFSCFGLAFLISWGLIVILAGPKNMPIDAEQSQQLLPPFSEFMVWILERTGSLLIVILTHTSLVFTTTVIMPVTLGGNSLLTWLLLWGFVLWILVLAIALFKGGILSQKGDALEE